ncbi:MAG: CAP domain-containing protein [bacterium]|nr:CAP domain-containing protein [bacterium]
MSKVYKNLIKIIAYIGVLTILFFLLKTTPLPKTIKSALFLITPAPTIQYINQQEQLQEQDDGKPWGVAKQVGPHTYTLKVGQDPAIATPQEAYDALNEYRYKNGREKLQWSDNLTSYAKSRSDYFHSQGNTDAHAGFVDFLENQDGFAKLGFNHVGENSSYGFRLNGVHLIEWMYAGDEEHDANQLSTSWTHVGIGITGDSTDFIFAAN